MSKIPTKTGSDLFIVDNSDKDWKVLNYLHDWCQLSEKMDIASGFFEIGSLLALEDEWQKVDEIRILMGDEVSKRTKQAFKAGLANVKDRLDNSIEDVKIENDFLTGVAAVVEGIRSGKIKCRVYRKDKFHAKAYITHARLKVVGSAALVGSSNFTFPGLTSNVELNVQITGRPVSVLQEWFEEHWEKAEDVTPEILETIERHTKDYTPFDVFTKSLFEFFRGHEMTATEWERNESMIYPVLAGYQKEGYHVLLKHANRYGGAFLCDGVGLGKTFIGLMVIERMIMYERKNVALFVPKSARKSVWEKELRERLPHLFGSFSHLEIFNHSDLLREKLEYDFRSVAERADVIMIDEAHNFRNTGIHGKSRYWQLYNITKGKTVFMLTATPVNNRLLDLLHMIELFTHDRTDHFEGAPLGIHSIRGHFLKMEKSLEELIDNKDEAYTDTNLKEAERILSNDFLFRELVVQRSRAYVKKSLLQEEGEEVVFPEPTIPKVKEYSVKQTYGKLLKMVEDAFHKEKPLFSLPVYYPFAYYKGDDDSIDPMVEGRQKQVVALIRTGFLKRFESSAEAFKMSCWNLLKKLMAWIEVHQETDFEKKLYERWKLQNAKLIDYMHQQEMDLWDNEDEEDIVSPELLELAEKEKLDRNDFKIDEIIAETILDLDQIASFLKELQQFKPSQDKKLSALKQMLKNDPTLEKHKLLIFTEFKDTAVYLKKQLIAEGFEGVSEIDSSTSGDRDIIIRRFAPYYNGSSSSRLAEGGLEEIRVLVSTDVLSEGLNLQDATMLINYDIHWNPVRLMQRIGRIDRRLNPEIEDRIISDHPDQAKLRGKISYWNFLPPDELNELLSLYAVVTKKTLRISKTFGIEGRKLLTPEDDYDDLKDFIEDYEGTISPLESMHLEYQKLMNDYPELEEKLNKFPLKVFSGKENIKPDSKAVFFCYTLPSMVMVEKEGKRNPDWSLENGQSQWYLYDIEKETILQEAPEIIEYIRSTPETPRRCVIERPTLTEIRKKVDKHIEHTYLKRVQAPKDIKPILKAWMELN